MTVDLRVASSHSCSFCRSDSPSIRGMLMSLTTMSMAGFCSIVASASRPSCANIDLDRALADLPAEFLLDEGLEIGLVVDEQNGDAHAACPSLVSISWRSSEKSIGLVNRPSAPRSIAFFLVSASP